VYPEGEAGACKFSRPPPCGSIFPVDQILRLHTQLASTALGIIFCTAAVTTALGWWLIAR